MIYARERISGLDHDGLRRYIATDHDGHISVISRAVEHVNTGDVFVISKFFPDTADNATIEMLREVGGTNDQHILEWVITVQGFWEYFIYREPTFLATGSPVLTPIDKNMRTNNTSDGIVSKTPTIISTAVDAASASGQKVLNVSDTDGFVADSWVTIDFGEVGVKKNEQAQIDTIQAGVSLTMKSNLLNTYTNEAVEATGQVIQEGHAEGGTKKAIDEAGAGTADWVFKSGGNYLMRLTNRSGAVARCTMKVKWMELPKRV